MKDFFIPLLAALCLESMGQADPDRFGGPTELQDTFLPAQLRYQTYPESARVIPSGSWKVGVDVDWTAHLAHTDTYLFDGESVTTTLKLRHNLYELWEMGIDLPYTVRVDGRADKFIEFVETTLNARVPARYVLPRDTYQATLVTDENRVMIFRKGSGLNDITLRAKRQVTRSEEFGFDTAVGATFSLPTGENTFGSDGVSPGLNLHTQKPFKYFNLYAGAAGVYYTDRHEQGFDYYQLRGMTYGGAAWKPFNWGELLFIYQVYSALAPDHSPLDDPAHYYSVTGRFWLTPRITFEAGVVENLGLIENRNSSDVTFKFALNFLF